MMAVRSVCKPSVLGVACVLVDVLVLVLQIHAIIKGPNLVSDLHFFVVGVCS